MSFYEFRVSCNAVTYSFLHAVEVTKGKHMSGDAVQTAYDQVHVGRRLGWTHKFCLKDMGLCPSWNQYFPLTFTFNSTP